MSHRTRISMVIAAVLTLMILVRTPALANDHHAAEAHAEKHEVAHAAEHAAPAAPAKESFFSKLTKPAKEFYGEFMAKLHDLQMLDETVESQRKQIAELQAQVTALKSSHVSEAEHERANEIKQNALAEGGSENARTIASLVVARKQLMSKPPKVIYQTAVKAFESQDYETAAAGFDILANNEDNTLYHTAQVFYDAGVSLYMLNNYKKAQKSFENALRLSRTEHTGRAVASEGEELAPRTMAWLSLCKSRVGDLAGARHMVHELIQSYPKSREARRLNRNENFQAN